MIFFVPSRTKSCLEGFWNAEIQCIIIWLIKIGLIIVMSGTTDIFNKLNSQWNKLLIVCAVCCVRRWKVSFPSWLIMKGCYDQKNYFWCWNQMVSLINSAMDFQKNQWNFLSHNWKIPVRWLTLVDSFRMYQTYFVKCSL